MRRDDDDSFRPRPGAPRSRAGPSVTRYVSRVLRTAQRAGPNALRTRARAPQAKPSAVRFGRGHVAARLVAGAISRRTRRVAIKARLVHLRRASPRSTALHLKYIEREGVGRHGEAGRAYDATTDAADLDAFQADSREDRHQFRFIVSAEDALQLDDLKSFTRDLMGQMERDLETRLTWVAVDHWDTDDPHTHIVVRGKDEHGDDLVIARDYIAHGMRVRACQIATQWLGPRTEIEINASLDCEVMQERWTGLDRTLQQQSSIDGTIQLADVSTAERARLIGRLQRLAVMGLAEEAAGRWWLRPSHEPTLRALGERGDIVRTMQRAMKGATRELSIHDAAQLSHPILGRIASRGWVAEMDDRTYLVIDGLDGRAHYLILPARIEPAELPINGIVEVRGAHRREADHNIVVHARNGLYQPSLHRASLQGHDDAEEIVTRHVRRLEALRRAGIVERVHADAWRVPDDFLARAQHYDRQRDGGLTVAVRSTLSLEQQQRAMGATWLDQQLLKHEDAPAPVGFGAEVRHALERRAESLIEQGLAQRRGSQLVFVRDLLKTLQTKELGHVADQLGHEFHRPLRLPTEGERVAGIYRRSLMLASGRFALLDEGASIALVPWRSIMESRLGQSMSGVVRQGVVSWNFERSKSRER